MEIIQKITTNFLGDLKAKTIVIWWLVLYNPTMLWGVIRL